MTMNTRLFTAALLVGSGMASVAGAADFQHRFYGGLGLGISQLEPETKDTGFEVDDKQDLGGKVYLGMDFARRWSAEIYYGDLGAAALDKPNPGAAALDNPNKDTQGDIDYALFGLAALYHFYNNRGTDGLMRRAGWDWFAKAGVGSLDNSSDLPFKKQKGTHVMLGLGTEYGWDNGFAIRLEGETFDQDVQFVSVGLLKRFGGDHTSARTAPPTPVAPPPVAAEPPEPPPVPVPAPMPVVPESTPMIGDADSDGVNDEDDACPDTLPGSEVNEQGCDVFSGVLEGVQFESGSARLTTQSQEVLQGVALELLQHPDVRVAVMAHTDNSGAAKANLALSKQRAISVVRYLMSLGVAVKRMRPVAYGESRPRASNATPEGRLANRRVEFQRIE